MGQDSGRGHGAGSNDLKVRTKILVLKICENWPKTGYQFWSSWIKLIMHIAALTHLVILFSLTN